MGDYHGAQNASGARWADPLRLRRWSGECTSVRVFSRQRLSCDLIDFLPWEDQSKTIQPREVLQEDELCSGLPRRMSLSGRGILVLFFGLPIHDLCLP